MEVLVKTLRAQRSNDKFGQDKKLKQSIPCDKDLTGEFVNVKITGKTWYLKGELV
ncbi:MAG: hypothetical protein ACLSA2_02770 [Candidatus Gastranaerophilaceae bacterium]